ncbi:Tyrosine recombinase XerC [subsurface metagenome]
MRKTQQVVRFEERPVARTLDMPSLIEDFLAAQDVRPISKEVYRKGMERFLSWIASNGIQQPDREAILRFKTFLIELNLAANTVNSYLVAVKRFFAYLEGKRLYPDIAKGVKGAKQPKVHLREALTIAQVQEMLAAIDTSTIRGKRDFSMINLMARTGLRTIEVIRADVEDIKQQGGEGLLFVQGKGRDSKDDFVILTDAALRPIRHYLKARGVSDQKAPLFVSLSDRNKGQRLTTKTIREAVKNYLKKVNIDSPKLCAHSLRHFFATQALKAGSPLLQVKEAMRHASIETTQKYLHNLERIEKGAERFIEF